MLWPDVGNTISLWPLLEIAARDAAMPQPDAWGSGVTAAGITPSDLASTQPRGELAGAAGGPQQRAGALRRMRTWEHGLGSLQVGSPSRPRPSCLQRCALSRSIHHAYASGVDRSSGMRVYWSRLVAYQSQSEGNAEIMCCNPFQLQKVDIMSGENSDPLKGAHERLAA